MAKNIYFKITTVPATIESNSKEFELFYDKYAETKSLTNYEDAFKVFLNESPKNPLFGKVYSIAVSFVAPDSDAVRVKLLKGNEKSILQEFINIINSEYFTGYKPVIWNSEFVLPFLSSRCTKNGISVNNLPSSLKHYGLKPWSLQCVDLQGFIKGVGWYSMSLEETAFIHNLPTDFIDASDIYTLWSQNQFDTIDSSSVDEVKTITNIHRTISGEKPLEELNLDVVVLEEEVKEIELPILIKIYNSKNFAAHKEELRQQLLERGYNKKTPKAEKETVKELVLAHYLERTAFDDMDKKAKEVINKTRTEEVNEFFKSL